MHRNMAPALAALGLYLAHVLADINLPVGYDSVEQRCIYTCFLSWKSGAHKGKGSGVTHL